MAVDKDAWSYAERTVLGSLLTDPRCAGEVFRQAKAEYFKTEPLRHVFEAAQSLWAENRPIDAVTVLHAAGDEYHDWIGDCMAYAPTAANLGEHLRILRSEYRLSAIQDAASYFALIRTEEEAIDAYERIGLLLRESDTIEDLSWTELLIDYLDRMNSKEPPNYLSWGIKQLDEQLFVSPGKFVVLAADSSVGKTALALQFAYHMASSGKKVLFFSLETDKESLEDRLMAERQVANIAMPRTKLRALTSEDYMRATSAGDRSSKIFLRVIRRADSIAQIQNRTIMHRADVIFIDYLQIIDHKARGRTEVVAEISMALHRMAQRLGVTIIALSQVTPPEGGEITIQDLRESNQIKHDAEVILLMMKDKAFQNARKLVIGKDKDGATNKKLLLSFDPEHMTFSYAQRKAPEEVPGQLGPTLVELDDDEGGEIPF